MKNNKTTVISKNDAKTLEETRKKIIDLKKNITKTYIGMARLLMYVSEATVASKPIYKHWGFDTFEQYCEEELNMSSRKAEMLISISKFVDNKILADPSFKGKEEYILSEIDQIGWSKAYLLPKVVVTPKDFDRWVDTAKKMGRREFRQFVVGNNSTFNAESEDGKPQKFVSYNFKVINSGSDIVDTVFDHIRRVNGENLVNGPMGDGMVLVRLCQHYLSNLNDNSYSIDSILTSIMDTYGIKEINIKYLDGKEHTIERQDGNAINNGKEKQDEISG